MSRNLVALLMLILLLVGCDDRATDSPAKTQMTTPVVFELTLKARTNYTLKKNQEVDIPYSAFSQGAKVVISNYDTTIFHDSILVQQDGQYKKCSISTDGTINLNIQANLIEGSNPFLFIPEPKLGYVFSPSSIYISLFVDMMQ